MLMNKFFEIFSLHYPTYTLIIITSKYRFIRNKEGLWEVVISTPSHN